MKKETKKQLKVYLCGVLSGALILVTSNYYAGQIIKKQNTNLKNEFSLPHFEESFQDTKEVQQYAFDYYGEEIKIQGEKVKIHSFDEFSNYQVKEGETVTVPIKDNDYLLDEYISEKEADVFKILKNKDKIVNQYAIYETFNRLEKVYEEYLTRKPFPNLDNRKEALYKVYYDYIVAEEGYTMGGYKFLELDKTIQKDILKIYQNVNQMRKTGEIKETSKLKTFIKQKEKVIKYGLLKIGR